MLPKIAQAFGFVPFELLEFHERSIDAECTALSSVSRSRLRDDGDTVEHLSPEAQISLDPSSSSRCVGRGPPREQSPGDALIQRDMRG